MPGVLNFTLVDVGLRGAAVGAAPCWVNLPLTLVGLAVGDAPGVPGTAAGAAAGVPGLAVGDAAGAFGDAPGLVLLVSIKL